MTNIDKLFRLMDRCEMCPHKCLVNRNVGQVGFCRTDGKIFIASQNIHFGEEPPISGTRGSGTIFFTNCSLKCVYCQNYPISQLGNGKEISQENLARAMVDLQGRGAHNINLVTPTHYSAQIAKAIVEAKAGGLKIPVVYNSSGYESVEALRLLEGLIDIYMPDMKYGEDELGEKYSGVKGYTFYNRLAIKEMFRQVGHLRCDDLGIAKRGLLIRHLVLPRNVDSSKKVLGFIAGEISADTFVSIMGQYHEAYRAGEFAELLGKVSDEEYEEVKGYMDELGIENGWVQEI